MNKFHVIVCAGLFLSPGVVWADESASCKMGGVVRKIEIHQTISDNSDGCEVLYIKESESPGSSTSLWNAKLGQAYCREKARGFIQKLTGMGWSCDRTFAEGGASQK